ncbi:protein ALWAYS EARLY 3 isoform X6 [Malus domestica]|uniref:protein ALWAYS EARLY 3 isoform X6 n=1 Tax=Malus domestica TaxID=3750 RepID=UPI0039759DF2
MPPTRKSKSVSKRFSYNNEASSKHGEHANTSGQKKRKLSDMLGPQWSKEELKHFYEAYRKYGKDWKKVAAVVRHRSVEMVEALYTMNKAYLSLPEGVASVIGLTAMMTDHYSLLGGSDSEQESIEGVGTPWKPQKHERVKFQTEVSKRFGHIPDSSQSPPMASSNDCLSLLNNRRSGIRPHAVKKRTPRVPVAYSSDKDDSRNYVSPARRGLKPSVDTKNDDVANEIALALTEASHRGDSPLVSWKSKRKAKGTPPTVRNGEMMGAESEMTTTRLRASEMDEGGHELSLGSTEADNEDFDRSKKYAVGTEGTDTLDFQRRGKRYSVKKQKVENKSNHFEDIKEAGSGTEEGQKRDESTPFDALQTLADLSLMMPETADTESSAHVREEDSYVANKSKTKGIHSIPGVEHSALKTSKPGKLKEGGHQSNTGLQKRKQLLPFKVYNDATQTDCRWSDNQRIEATVEVNKSMNKGKRSSHYITHPKQGKSVNPLQNASSSTDHEREENNSGLSTLGVPSANQANLPARDSIKLKLDRHKPSIEKDRKSTEGILDEQPDKRVPSFRNREINIKERLSNCLSRYQVQRWCAFEWFYSAIDYPWFAKREFVEYLNHVGLGHVPRLTRVEWGVIRSSLGRPRRFSEQFLKEEKEKLNQYRESVRTHYAELNAGTREGLPTDLARPLSVGQHVIAFHPTTREIHNGIVLTVDHSRCRVQFDQPELGVEHIMDIDCMPLNPVENLPASFTKHNVNVNVNVNKYIENLKELKINERLKEGKTEGYKVASSDHVESTVPCYMQPSPHHINKSSKQTEDAVVSELRHMNDEVVENHRDGDNFIRDSESFKKEYAAVLLQLSQVNDQVSSALCCLRQRNTYRGSPAVSLVKPMENISDPGGHSSPSGYSCHAQESAGHVFDIVESSRAKARKMVDAAMQAISSLRKEDNLDRMEEIIDFVSNRLSDDAGVLGPSTTPADPVRVSQDQPTACTSKPMETSCSADPKSNNVSKQNEEKALTDLIVNCVAAFLMIQTCTARQFPPSEVAQVVDEAVTSLQPLCPQNLSVYGEIQKCMGIIRNQILALVPT